MPDLARVVHFLEFRVLHAIALLEDGVRQHVDVLVDRTADDEPAALAVERRNVGAATAKADSKRRAREDHAHRTAASTEYAAPSSHASVRLIACRIVNVGCQPNARIFSQ